MSRSWEMDDGIQEFHNGLADQLRCWEQDGITDWHAMDKVIQDAIDRMQDDEYEFYHGQPYQPRKSDNQ